MTLYREPGTVRPQQVINTSHPTPPHPTNQSPTPSSVRVFASETERYYPTPPRAHPTKARPQLSACVCKRNWTLLPHPTPPHPTKARPQLSACVCKRNWTLLPHPHPTQPKPEPSSVRVSASEHERYHPTPPHPMFMVVVGSVMKTPVCVSLLSPVCVSQKRLCVWANFRLGWAQDHVVTAVVLAFVLVLRPGWRRGIWNNQRLLRVGHRLALSANYGRGHPSVSRQRLHIPECATGAFWWNLHWQPLLAKSRHMDHWVPSSGQAVRVGCSGTVQCRNRWCTWCRWLDSRTCRKLMWWRHLPKLVEQAIRHGILLQHWGCRRHNGRWRDRNYSLRAAHASNAEWSGWRLRRIGCWLASGTN